MNKDEYKGFSMIPNQIGNPKLGITASARFLLCLLIRHCGTHHVCWPSKNTLAREMGLSTARQAHDYLVELKTAGLITWRHGGGHRSNTYSILLKLRNSSSYQLGTRVPTYPGTAVPLNNIHGIRKKNKGFEIVGEIAKRNPRNRSP